MARIDACLAKAHEYRQQAIADHPDQPYPPAIGETLFLGHDTEFQEHPGNRLHPLALLSQQIHAIGDGGQLSAAYIPTSGRYEDRISLNQILKDLIPELMRRGVIISPPDTIVFAGFFARLDMAMFPDFVDFRHALCSVNGRLATTGKGVPTLVCDQREMDKTLKDRRWHIEDGPLNFRTRICFYDVALHAAEKTPLHVLGELIGRRKRKIKPPYHISRMAEYRRERPKQFLLYAMQDAQITIEYYLRVLKFASEELGGRRIADGLLPVSVGSLSVQIFKKSLKEAELDYETVFGLKTVTKKPWDTPKHRYGSVSMTTSHSPTFRPAWIGLCAFCRQQWRIVSSAWSKSTTRPTTL